MNKLFLALFSLLAISCQEQSHKIDPTNTTGTINPLADPNEFIGQHKAKVMILGVYHFDNPGLDEYKEKYEVEILSMNRQEELNKLLKKLEKYKPTKILLEASRINWDSTFNANYTSYKNGKFDIRNKRNEWYQIGFKLARKLDHEKIYCVDEKSKWFGADIDWEKIIVKNIKNHLDNLKKQTDIITKKFT